MWSYSRWNIKVIFSLHTPWAVAWFLVWCSNAVGKPPEIKLNYPHTWLRCKFLGFPWFGEINEIHNLSAPYSDVAWLYHDWNPLHWLVQLPHDLFQNYNLLDMARILGKASWHQWTYSTGVGCIPHSWWKHMKKIHVWWCSIPIDRFDSLTFWNVLQDEIAQFVHWILILFHEFPIFSPIKQHLALVKPSPTGSASQPVPPRKWVVRSGDFAALHLSVQDFVAWRRKAESSDLDHILRRRKGLMGEMSEIHGKSVKSNEMDIIDVVCVCVSYIPYHTIPYTIYHIPYTIYHTIPYHTITYKHTSYSYS